MKVNIIKNEKNIPAGKLADAELVFEESDGILAGTKLIGFSVWESRHNGGKNVTFPARQYAVNGEKRSFALFRPVSDQKACDRVKERIILAYDAS